MHLDVDVNVTCYLLLVDDKLLVFGSRVFGNCRGGARCSVRLGFCFGGVWGGVGFCVLLLASGGLGKGKGVRVGILGFEREREEMGGWMLVRESCV